MKISVVIRSSLLAVAFAFAVGFSAPGCVEDGIGGAGGTTGTGVAGTTATGGTGVALRDVTPEAVLEIAVRELPGFGEAMRMESLKITRNAILSRNLAAVVDKTLVICLPGKPSGAVECLGFVAGAIPHCVEVLQEVPTSC